MQLRARPQKFVRSFVDAATVRPFWNALRDMKQARIRVPAPVVAPPLEPEAPARAA